MKNKGFTLVEIMIVVAIIALLATIALPGLLRTRLTANESSAISALRTIATAAETFRTAQLTPAYPTSLEVNLTNATPPYVTGFTCVGGNCTKTGYGFSVAGSTNEYQAVANPSTSNVTGVRSFCIDHTGIMRAQVGAYTAASSGTCGGSSLQ